MNGKLNRVQVYLDREDVSILDEVAKKLKVTRSQLVREATRAVAERYLKALRLLEQEKPKKNPLVQLIGLEKSKTGKVGLDVDELYLHD